VVGGPLDRGDQRGHFGANLTVWLWLWRWLGSSGVKAVFFSSKIVVLCLGRSCACGSGGVAVVGVSLDRGDQRGHIGASYISWLWLWRWLGGSGVRAEFH
jgi:hypothetical protein